MTIQWQKTTGMAIAVLILALATAPAWAESLFETYTQMTRADLAAETGAMGKSLQQTFREEDISRKQMQIDFSEYRSNLKKALHYAARLASYDTYEQDLAFARDKEIFQGLPETAQEAGSEDAVRDKQDFMTRKYDRMRQNVDEEVNTYVDLLLLSLDACETLTRHDLSGFMAARSSREVMREFLRDDAARAYGDRRAKLAGRWSGIAGRIDAQLLLWGEPAAGPDDPIINPQIVKALQ